METKEPNTSPLPIETQSQTKSPSGDKEELFDFFTAMKKVAEGKRISKKEWKNTKIYCEVKEERLILHKEDGTNHPWIISTGDLTGKDWFGLK